jgi:hypothetical protein
VVGLPADREVGEPVRVQDGDLDQGVEFAGPRAALIPASLPSITSSRMPGSGAGGDELGQELLGVAVDVVADVPHYLERLAAGSSSSQSS